MSGRYDDMLDLPHHVSPRRRQMPITDRAAQFSPFAALTGFEEALAETGRLTDRQIDLDVDGTAMLDEKLRFLAERLDRRPEVTVTWFQPDDRKSGGAYVSTPGRVRGIDPGRGLLLLDGGTAVPFARIRDIDGDIFA